MTFLRLSVCNPPLSFSSATLSLARLSPSTRLLVVCQPTAAAPPPIFATTIIYSTPTAQPSWSSLRECRYTLPTSASPSHPHPHHLPPKTSTSRPSPPVSKSFSTPPLATPELPTPTWSPPTLNARWRIQIRTQSTRSRPQRASQEALDARSKSTPHLQSINHPAQPGGPRRVYVERDSQPAHQQVHSSAHRAPVFKFPDIINPDAARLLTRQSHIGLDARQQPL